jgi:hypothetical protein
MSLKARKGFRGPEVIAIIWGLDLAPQLSDAQISKELEQYENDLSWVVENYTSLIEKYGNEFVAVLNQEVLVHAKTIQQLMEELSTKFKADCNRAVIEFIYIEHPNFVLHYARNMQT